MLPITMTTPAFLHKKMTSGSEKSLFDSELSSPSSEIEEARNLVKRCAEPRPVGDSVKEAINRASTRLGFTHSRTKDLWYGEAGRIRVSVREMDSLRAVAAVAEIDQGIVCLTILRARLSSMSSAAARQAIDGIDAVLIVLGGGAHDGIVSDEIAVGKEAL
jgi:hypothetical protein